MLYIIVCAYSKLCLCTSNQLMYLLLCSCTWLVHVFCDLVGSVVTCTNHTVILCWHLPAVYLPVHESNKLDRLEPLSWAVLYHVVVVWKFFLHCSDDVCLGRCPWEWYANAIWQCALLGMQLLYHHEQTGVSSYPCPWWLRSSSSDLSCPWWLWCELFDEHFSTLAGSLHHAWLGLVLRLLAAVVLPVRCCHI